jgi:hypothetical protein
VGGLFQYLDIEFCLHSNIFPEVHTTSVSLHLHLVIYYTSQI